MNYRYIKSKFPTTIPLKWKLIFFFNYATNSKPVIVEAKTKQLLSIMSWDFVNLNCAYTVCFITIQFKNQQRHFCTINISICNAFQHSSNIIICISAQFNIIICISAQFKYRHLYFGIVQISSSAFRQSSNILICIAFQHSSSIIFCIAFRHSSNIIFCFVFRQSSNISICIYIYKYHHQFKYHKYVTHLFYKSPFCPHRTFLKCGLSIRVSTFHRHWPLHKKTAFKIEIYTRPGRFA
jgi:hypothetical protein